jgi:hypothetical protein
MLEFISPAPLLAPSFLFVGLPNSLVLAPPQYFSLSPALLPAYRLKTAAHPLFEANYYIYYPNRLCIFTSQSVKHFSLISFYN